MSRNALNVSTATLSNQSTIQGGGGVSLNATDRLQNDGKILSGSNLTLTAQVLALCDRTVRIPREAHCESLNAARAAAVLLWEAYR